MTLLSELTLRTYEALAKIATDIHQSARVGEGRGRGRRGGEREREGRGRGRGGRRYGTKDGFGIEGLWDWASVIHMA